jgi:hypothetical protein
VQADLCFASTSVCAAVLASVRHVRMDAPLQAVLQQMASLVSLHVGGHAWTATGPLASAAAHPAADAAGRWGQQPAGSVCHHAAH